MTNRRVTLQRRPASTARVGSLRSEHRRPERSAPGPAAAHRPSALSWVAIGAVVLVVAGLVAARALSSSTPAQRSSGVSAVVMHDVSTVPASGFDAAGTEAAGNPPVALPTWTPPLTSAGRPQVVYVGAEYCPYCAAERWAMVVALSRFGSFSGLGATESATSDVYPQTATFSFHGSTYRSPYLVFTPVELQTNQPAPGGAYTQLERPTALERSLMADFDRPPYTGGANVIPFTDIGNRFVMSGSSFDPGVLQGLTMSQIARDLHDPQSPVALAVLGGANQITAAICSATGGQPRSVCSSPAVRAASAALRSQ